MSASEKEEGVHVVVDTREPGEVLGAVTLNPAVGSWGIDSLPAGDLLIGEVLFERKTWSDYASSLTGKSGRTWDDQLRKLQEVKDDPMSGVEHVYVLVDDDMGGADRIKRSHINPDSLWGSAASVTARYGFPVIPCGDTDLLVKYAIKLARKHSEPRTTVKGLKATSVSAGEPAVMRMYGCLPGVGPKTARALYDRFPSLPELVAASPDTISSIEGVGETRANAIYDTLRGVDEEVGA